MVLVDRIFDKYVLDKKKIKKPRILSPQTRLAITRMLFYHHSVGNLETPVGLVGIN